MRDKIDERYERKFVIQGSTLSEVEDIIKHNPLMFSEIFYKRRVNNIYLDSEDMENYKNNIEGNSQRLKVRVRWYDNLFGLIRNPILQLKIKREDTTKKLSFPLKQFVLNKDFSSKALQKEIFDKSNLSGWLNEMLKLSQLSLLNCYERKYFLSNNKKYRITLDNNLRFFEIKNKDNLFIYKLEDKQSIILEIKYNKKEDNQIDEVTKNFPFRLTKISKYVSGVGLLHSS